ncbi:hypothetical protein WMY93_016677 [Mugilogobius chulae]|uniref:Uncharacterized protein n=1 Tax=Mugilogobius chulae TaxID=88201 RepID=A0AAW0NQV9_9GOBI
MESKSHQQTIAFSDELSGSIRDNPVVLHRIPDFDQNSWTEPQKLSQNGTDLLSQSTLTSITTTHLLQKVRLAKILPLETDTTTVSDEPSDESENNEEITVPSSLVNNDNAVVEMSNGTGADLTVANGDEGAQTSEEDNKESS